MSGAGQGNSILLPIRSLLFGAEPDAEPTLLQEREGKAAVQVMARLHRAVRTLIHDGAEQFPPPTITGSEGEHWCIFYRFQTSWCSNL